MNELTVNVSQTTGEITWNFEDLKKALRQEMETYKSLVYTEEALPEAKKTVATLRKLKTEVESRRKEIKNKCLEPYALIERQAKELTTIIDEPINLINKQVNDYETAQKEERKRKIIEYMTDKFSVLPADIAQKAKFKVYDPRWENKTAKEKDWKAAVDSCLDDVTRSIGLLNNAEEEFREQAIKVYSQNLELSAAIAKIQELQEQKQRIIAAEEKRRERERLEAERREAEKARQAELKPNNEEFGFKREESAAIPEVKTENGFNGEASGAEETVVTMPDITAEGIAAGTITVSEGAVAPDDGSILLRVYGTEKEQDKILEYITFMGVKFDKI